MQKREVRPKGEAEELQKCRAGMFISKMGYSEHYQETMKIDKSNNLKRVAHILQGFDKYPLTRLCLIKFKFFVN